MTHSYKVVTVHTSLIKSVQEHPTTGSTAHSAYAHMRMIRMHKLKVTVLAQNRVQGSQLCLALPDLPAGDDCAWEHTVRHCLVQDQMQMLIHSVLNTVFAEGAGAAHSGLYHSAAQIG